MIPIQLKDCKFCRIRKGTKKPLEKDWTNKPYNYESISNYFPKENYGILTGIDNLGVLDDDTEEKTLMNLFESIFGKSFRVRDHYYIKLKGWDNKKIIFYDSNGKHLGEVQGLGQQAVGPGSIHPSGAVYDLREDLPIKEIDFNKFKEVFQDYIPIIKEPPKQLTKRTSWTGDNVTDIPISSVISFADLKGVGAGCYQGPHPQHGSTKGMNFRVDTMNNVWYCYRCNSGGSSPELIAVMEGIISCHEAGRGCLRGEKGTKVINIARQKYGLKTPEVETFKKYEPKGWALSINIKKLAERKGMLKCPNPKCNKNFTFIERTGKFYCNCREGGIEDFMKLCLESDTNV